MSKKSKIFYKILFHISSHADEICVCFSTSQNMTLKMAYIPLGSNWWIYLCQIWNFSQPQKDYLSLVYGLYQISIKEGGVTVNLNLWFTHYVPFVFTLAKNVVLWSPGLFTVLKHLILAWIQNKKIKGSLPYL